MTQFTYLIAMEKLKTGDSINLLDMKSLSYVDLDKLFENIKFWKIHAQSQLQSNFVLDTNSLTCARFLPIRCVVHEF